MEKNGYFQAYRKNLNYELMQQYKYIAEFENDIYGSFNNYLFELTKYLLKQGDIEDYRLLRQSNNDNLLGLINHCLENHDICYNDVNRAVILFRDYKIRHNEFRDREEKEMKW